MDIIGHHKEFYNMFFNHNYAYGELAFFIETLDSGEVNYWINANEYFKNGEGNNFVAVKFSSTQLEVLRNKLNELEL